MWKVWRPTFSKNSFLVKKIILRENCFLKLPNNFLSIFSVKTVIAVCNNTKRILSQLIFFLKANKSINEKRRTSFTGRDVKWISEWATQGYLVRMWATLLALLRTKVTKTRPSCFNYWQQFCNTAPTSR